ncbi:polysaccharide deacetylase family protein [Alsobacter sp. SYSU M60028]|uniref:Chitooligosaccharide deacetylase n=1 Tax=Alsobacter ponti TaxID=2962936 RepID=A0ABT1LD80_9HYPH|nr:polysaccharide deacetylase family protein [Alsobacter ponti]MCP8939466.1 polysaccharide deacetylase family protein [Alsobacter ponti]
MALGEDYLNYPWRRHGMDHDRYPWSNLFERKPVTWPNGARVALWITPAVQWFPLDMTSKPFAMPGGLTMPFPDLRHYTNRDYGNRVGIYRILDVLAERKLPASVAVNGAIAERYPSLVRDIVAAGHEIVAHGLDMGHAHHSGLAPDAENEIVARTLRLLREASGQEVTGWLSPGRAQSHATPDLLAENGVAYCCDWANDDMPFEMSTRGGPLLAMPLAYETDDRVVMLDFHHTEDSWAEQVKDRFDVLYREAESHGGRIVSIPLHAWVTGVPYRIGKLREVLDHILAHEDVWPATGRDIVAAFRSQA